MSPPLTLAAAGWESMLLPALGGATATLRYQGEDVLRPTPEGADDPLQAANFPLVPYANRIAQGRFVVGGHEIVLPRNFGDHPHTLHGIGWQVPWEVVAADQDHATLRLAHRADAAWPWDFTAEQHLSVGAYGFEARLTLRNLDAQAMPAGLGFHPYFPASPDTRFRARVEGAWLSDDTQLPVKRVAGDHFGDWPAGDSAVRTELVDHCHNGWDGEARIEQGSRTVVLRGEGTRWLHLYMPPGEAYFCAEPVSHLPDAVNRPDAGMQMLAPGEAMEIAMRIEVVEA